METVAKKLGVQPINVLLTPDGDPPSDAVGAQAKPAHSSFFVVIMNDAIVRFSIRLHSNTLRRIENHKVRNRKVYYREHGSDAVVRVPPSYFTQAVRRKRRQRSCHR